ncbi:FAD-binding domain-containing protein [Lentithecium fluviatile CBS 122367]|uniref:FAD-binding domain-containing protein n=1 Tax=Lentithecium fluviatile CBS 122367 TaxID=1168545 RepID=A0A6G1II07_9PLEO|nr:FAD-binding domain-containing protein [Lentithecium fluviatile CBS 122367]
MVHCTALNYYLPDKVATVADARYATSLLSYYSGQEQSVHPTCIVVPTSAQDVSTAVSILNVGFQANVPGCKFAVRGAGHTPHAGSANIEGGVTIDLQSVNAVTISADKKTVSIGGGNRWGNVYTQLDEQEVVMVGGRVTQVGVGGLLTGGGVSFFSGRYGFACNNIQSYEVVLGNGTIVTASSTKNAPLFRALKGGTNNFGVVTSFTAKLYAQSAFWGGQITQPVTNKEAYFDFLVKFVNSATYDPYAALISVFVWIQGAPAALLQTPTYTDGNATWPPEAFKPLDEMPKLTTTIRKEKLASFTNELGADVVATQGRQSAFLTLSFVNDPEVAADFMAKAWELSNVVAQDLITVAGLVWVTTYQPLPYVLYSKDASANVMGFGRFKDDLINLLFVPTWTLATDTERVYARMRQLEADLVALEKDMGIYNPWIYLNYAAPWQKPIESYGDANVAFLKSVSKQYDPRGVFQKAVPGGFKLGM